VPEQALSRRGVIETLSAALEDLDYGRVAGPVKGAAAIYYKAIDGLFLTLGVEFSTRYDDRFTGSFYLSRSLEWAYVVRGFPMEAYQRIGHFLDSAERHRLLDPIFTEPGVVDAWWIGFTDSTVSAFVEAVRLTESRFLGQDGIRDAVLQSEGLKRHRDLLDEVARTTAALTAPPDVLIAQPKRYPAGVDPKWFWAAEVIISSRRPELLKPEYITLVALDAWRVVALAGGSKGGPRATPAAE
jgi:hypothetical protein